MAFAVFVHRVRGYSNDKKMLRLLGISREGANGSPKSQFIYKIKNQKISQILLILLCQQLPAAVPCKTRGLFYKQYDVVSIMLKKAQYVPEDCHHRHQLSSAQRWKCKVVMIKILATAAVETLNLSNLGRQIALEMQAAFYHRGHLCFPEAQLRPKVYCQENSHKLGDNLTTLQILLKSSKVVLVDT